MTTIPPFDDITVSTKTIIGVSNLTIPISDLYQVLSVEKYVVIPKKRGRQKKIFREDPNKDLEEGSIITLKYQDECRGVDLNAKKNKKKKTLTKKKFFRNALTVVMKVDNKLINFKISKNGKFQMTGVKYDEQAVKCIKYFWNKLKNTKYYEIDKKYKIFGKILVGKNLFIFTFSKTMSTTVRFLINAIFRITS